MKRALFLLLAAVVAGSIAARYAFTLLLERPGPPLPAPVRVDVETGEPFRTTARKLEAAGLVRNALALRIWSRWKGVDRQIQHGAYRFTEALPATAVVERMRSGEAMIIRVTLPEGATSRDLATILEHAELGSAAKYEALTHDAAFARSLGILADGLEGYLYPDTYFFSPLDGPEKILATFVSRFHAEYTGEMAGEAMKQGLSTHQVVTLASVIEKETGREDERPLISAVFRNRLRLGMPLQADPTVIYGIANFNGNLTRKDLETRTPYNTYTAVGLPAGPIANPGRPSLVAVLHPADVPYLYFVSREDGSHEFNTRLAEHNRAVNRYQRAHRSHAEKG